MQVDAPPPLNSRDLKHENNLGRRRRPEVIFISGSLRRFWRDVVQGRRRRQKAVFRVAEKMWVDYRFHFHLY